jgi:hypothetical protein
LVLLGVVATAFASVEALSDFDYGGGLSSSRLERSYSERLEIWSDSLTLSLEYPFGIGPTKQIDGTSLRELVGAGEPHNDVLTMLLRGGPLALVGQGLVIFALWRLVPPATWGRAMIIFWLVTGLSRQTWNFRHFWLLLPIAVLVEEARRVAKWQATRGSE